MPISGQFEDFYPMQLQPMGLLDPLHGHPRQSLRLGHRTLAPVGGVVRCRVQRRVDDGFHSFGAQLGFSPRPLGIPQQAGHSKPLETFPPKQNRGRTDFQFGRDGMVRLALGSKPHDAGAQRMLLGRGARAPQCRQTLPLTIIDAESSSRLKNARSKGDVHSIVKIFMGQDTSNLGH